MIQVTFKFKPNQEVWVISKASDYSVWKWEEHYALSKEEIAECGVTKDMKPMYYTSTLDEVEESFIFATKQEAIDKLIELL